MTAAATAATTSERADDRGSRLEDATATGAPGRVRRGLRRRMGHRFPAPCLMTDTGAVENPQPAIRGPQPGGQPPGRPPAPAGATRPPGPGPRARPMGGAVPGEESQADGLGGVRRELPAARRPDRVDPPGPLDPEELGQRALGAAGRGGRVGLGAAGHADRRPARLADPAVGLGGTRPAAPGVPGS